MLLAISAHDIETAGYAVDSALPVAWLDAELTDASVTATAPGRVTGRLSRSGEEIVVRARVLASLVTPCARCLGPTKLEVDTELSLLLRPAPAAHASHLSHASHSSGANGANGAKKGSKKYAPASQGAEKPEKTAKTAKAKPTKAKPLKEEEYEFTSAEADTDTFDGETVLLDPFVREAILLELPNFPLCSEGCPGIGPGPEEQAAKPREAALDPRLAPLLRLRVADAKGERGPAGKKKPEKPEKKE